MVVKAVAVAVAGMFLYVSVLVCDSSVVCGGKRQVFFFCEGRILHLSWRQSLSFGILMVALAAHKTSLTFR